MGSCKSVTSPKSKIHHKRIKISEVSKQYINMDSLQSEPLLFRVELNNFRGRSFTKVITQLFRQILPLKFFLLTIHQPYLLQKRFVIIQILNGNSHIN